MSTCFWQNRMLWRYGRGPITTFTWYQDTQTHERRQSTVGEGMNFDACGNQNIRKTRSTAGRSITMYRDAAFWPKKKIDCVIIHDAIGKPFLSVAYLLIDANVIVKTYTTHTRWQKKAVRANNMQFSNGFCIRIRYRPRQAVNVDCSSKYCKIFFFRYYLLRISNSQTSLLEKLQPMWGESDGSTQSIIIFFFSLFLPQRKIFNLWLCMYTLGWRLVVWKKIRYEFQVDNNVVGQQFFFQSIHYNS